jgi:hypothetical protein
MANATGSRHVWNSDETEELKARWEAGEKLPTIAKNMGLSEKQVKNKLNKLKSTKAVDPAPIAKPNKDSMYLSCFDILIMKIG